MRLEPETLVSRWFGEHFKDLHPLLQTLHRHGGTLHGTINIYVGAGIAGWFGKRLARSIGVPLDRATRGFEVEIVHTQEALEWTRRFDNGAVMFSRFKPIGVWPTGYWLEDTGALKMRMTVDIVEQGWYWRPLRASLHRVPLPLILLPRSRAGKFIQNGEYHFFVEFFLPLFGKILSYGGILAARAKPN